MDPDEGLRVMLLAYRASQWGEAMEQAEALLAWLRCSGFAPQVSAGLAEEGLQFAFTDEWFNRTIVDTLARKILQAASYRLTNEPCG